MHLDDALEANCSELSPDHVARVGEEEEEYRRKSTARTDFVTVPPNPLAVPASLPDSHSSTGGLQTA